MIGQVNRLAELWWNWMGPMFWQASLLIAFLGVIDYLLRRHLWPQVRHALWLLVLVKLVLPPTFALPTGLVARLHPPAGQPMTTAYEGSPIPQAHPLGEGLDRPGPWVKGYPEPRGDREVTLSAGLAAEPGASMTLAGVVSARVSWKAVAMLGWLMGGLLLAVWLAAGYVRLSRRHCSPGRGGRVPESFARLLAATAQKLRLKRLPRVVVSPSIESPAVFGVLRPVLLLPARGTDSLGPREAEHILLHELAHLKRRDLQVHAFCLALQVIYWFNPLLYLVRRQLQHLRELCCDATVAGILRERTEDYRQTLLETAAWLLRNPSARGIGFLGLVENPSRLLARLQWLQKGPARHPRLRTASAVLVAGLVFAVLLPMAQAKKVAATPGEAASIDSPSAGSASASSVSQPAPPPAEKTVAAATGDVPVTEPGFGAGAGEKAPTGAWYYHVKTGGTGGQPVQSEAEPDLASCWNSIQAAFMAVKSRATPGPWIIQVDDEATYDEAVALTDLQTSAAETLTLTKAPWLAGRPTIYPTQPGKRALAINGLWKGVATSEPLPDQPGQPARRVTHVTIRGFTLRNNVQGTDRAAEQPLFTDNQAFLSEGLHIIEDCCFDGQNQVYDFALPMFVNGTCINTIFRRNSFQDFRRSEEALKQGQGREIFTLTPPVAAVAGQPQVTFADNVFCRNRGTVFVGLADVPNQRYYQVVFERNTLRDNYHTSILATVWRNPRSTIVRNNIFANNTAGSTARAAYEVLDASNTKIYHNTFFNNHVPRELSVRTDSPEGVEIKNNIFWPTPGSYCIEVVPESAENLVCVHNAFFADFQKDGYPPGFGFSLTENTEIVGLWSGKPLTTDAWNKASKHNGGNGYAFEGPALDQNLHLVAGSLCIDRGVGGVVGEDIDGQRRPVGAGCDLGADEYGTPGAAPAAEGKGELPLEGQQMGPGTPLCLAAHTGDVARIEQCLQEGAEVNKLDGRGYAPLHYAVQNDQKRAVETLLAGGADVNARDLQDQTPLFHAGAVGNRDVVELLISRGADLNARDRDGQTALHAAVAGRYKDVAELLIAKGAEVNAKGREGQTALHRAVENGQRDMVALLISQGAQLNAKDEAGLAPLHVAVANEQKDVVELLLSQGAQLDAQDGDGFTPLNYAIWNRDQGITRFLVAQGADVNYTPQDGSPPLHSAIMAQDVNTVRFLVDRGARLDVQTENGWSPLHYAVLLGNRDIIDLLVSRGMDTSALPLAACAGNLERVTSLVEQGAEVDAKEENGWTPLCWATCAGRTEVASFLIAKGADVRIKFERGQTPLHVAARNGHKDLSELLIAGGADISATTDAGLMPVHEAARNGHAQVVELFLAKGTDVNARTPDDSTPLHLAATRGHNEVVELLLAKGADPVARNKAGRTSLKLAIQYRCTPTVKLLQDLGVKE